MPETYTPLPAHTLSEKEVAYVEALPPREKKLHEMAQAILRSSYFVERTHAYRKASKK